MRLYGMTEENNPSRASTRKTVEVRSQIQEGLFTKSTKLKKFRAGCWPGVEVQEPRVEVLHNAKILEPNNNFQFSPVKHLSHLSDKDWRLD
jgi:hypothetical protein